MTSKSCRVCKETKVFEDFIKRPDRKNAYRNICKVCHNKSTKAYYHENKESRSEYNKAWREDNKDDIKAKSKAYYKENKDSVLNYTKTWRSENKEKVLAYGANRRAVRLQACPPWLTSAHKIEIESFYFLAKDCEAISGQNYHVDHIVPLQGKGVCGLHVPWNLQILPSDINLSKHNNYNGW